MTIFTPKNRGDLLKTNSKIFWPTTLFLILTPIVMLIAVPWFIAVEGLKIETLIFAVLGAGITNITITAGYHRLFSHRSYEAKSWIEIIFLLIGASAFQGSALKWSSDHRVHHSRVDSDEDPYSIKKGFFYAHMGWLFYKDSVDRPIHAPDLEKNLFVSLQNRFYIPLAIFMGFFFPALLASLWGDFWGGFWIGGLARIVLTQHSTFFVNSLCHTLGKQTYSTEISARDSLLVAFLTHGEGYHNFHHKFQIDYRNGIRWYQWDPTKWTIQFLAFIGQAKKLRQVSSAEILKARLIVEERALLAKGLPSEKIVELKEKVFNAQIRLKKLKEDYAAMVAQAKEDYDSMLSQAKVDYEHILANAKVDYNQMMTTATEMRDHKIENFRAKINELKTEIELAKVEAEAALKLWSVYLRSMQLA